MSYKTKFFKWDVSPNYDQVGVPVGYEVECKVKSKDHLSYSLSTFRENSRIGHLSYSYDGETFYDFPTDETGKAFYTDYTMRLKITDALSGNTFVINDGIIYKTTSDLKRIIGKLDTGVSLSSISINHITNDVYSLVDSTLLSFSTKDEIRFLKSFNLGESSLDVVVDGGRNCFWQVCSDKIYKRDLDEADILTTYSLSSTLLSGVQTFLNKQNGNLVVSAQTSVGFEIFEFDFYSDTISSDTSSILILDIGQSDSGYFVTFGNPYLGEFSSGTLDETHVNTARNDVRNVSGDLSDFYLTDFYDQQLVKFSMPYSEEWEIDLIVGDGDLFSRGNDISAIYSNNGKLFLCGDDGVTISRLEFTNSSLFFGISGQTNPSHVNFQYRSIYGTERLEQSSSSSGGDSSSSSIDSSSSSSSSGGDSSSSSMPIADEFKITASDGAANDWFGYNVSINGDYAIVGVPYDDDNGINSGSAYIYERTSVNTWGNELKITASDGALGDIFGSAISINGDYAIVGAFGDDDNGATSGSVYIYERTSGNTWGNELKITASDAALGDTFGSDVSINGDYAIVGKKYDDDNGANSGSVYIYERTSGNIWGNELKITASDAAPNDWFGLSVSISGDYAIVGAPYDDDNGSTSGSVYIYERTSGNIWGNELKITASDAAANDWFGSDVSINGDYAIVGARNDDDNGTDSGSVYVYERTSGNLWGNELKITASDGSANDLFGSDVSISGDYVIVGARNDDDNGTDSGSVYVYERTSGNLWGNELKITASDGAANDLFGSAISISGDYAIVGARRDDDNGTDSGSVYIYRISG